MNEMKNNNKKKKKTLHAFLKESIYETKNVCPKNILKMLNRINRKRHTLLTDLCENHDDIDL